MWWVIGSLIFAIFLLAFQFHQMSGRIAWLNEKIDRISMNNHEIDGKLQELAKKDGFRYKSGWIREGG